MDGLTMVKLIGKRLIPARTRSLNINRKYHHFIILGGGISGLAAAQTIVDNCRVPYKVTLAEASSRLGGWVNTVRFEDGSIFELGPRTIRPFGVQGHNTLDLIEKLGLEGKVIAITGSHPATKRRFIYGKGKINELPSSLLSLISAQPPLSKSLLSTLIKEPFKPKCQDEDESVHQYFKRRLGDEVADYLSDSLCRGIFATGARELSIKACFPSLWEYEKNHGSIVKGFLFSKSDKPRHSGSLLKKAQSEKWRLWSLEGGLQTLTDKWVEHLLGKGLQIITDQPCIQVEFSNDIQKTVCHFKSHRLEGDHLFSTLPTFSLTPLLQSAESSLAEYLDGIPYVTVAVVNMEFQEKVLQQEGFGFLVPTCEPLKILGVIFDSCVFEDKNGTKLTVMMGGSHYEQYFGNPDTSDVEHLKNVATETTMKVLNISKEPTKCMVTIQKNCLPKYRPGHVELVSKIRRYISKNNLPLTIAGSAFDGVGINDCIFHSQNQVLKSLNKLNLT